LYLSVAALGVGSGSKSPSGVSRPAPGKQKAKSNIREYQKAQIENQKKVESILGFAEPAARMWRGVN
jgi:hypothetical protein